MKVFLGLGNPGVEYAMTRHNAGVQFVDKLGSVLSTQYSGGYGWRRKKEIMVFETKEIVLIKSAGIFMNESGRLINDFFSTSPLTPLQSLGEGNLYVAHDDLDIRLGEYKIQFGKGPKEHGGINSIEGVLGTKDFWRIRVGIDNREAPRNKLQDTNNVQIQNYNYQMVPGEEYVLQKFSLEEKGILDEVIGKILREL